MNLFLILKRRKNWGKINVLNVDSNPNKYYIRLVRNVLNKILI